MSYHPIRASNGTMVPVLEVTDTTVTVQFPNTGEIKTLPRPPWYRPDGPPRVEPATPTKKVVMSQMDTRIREGLWTTVIYSDGSGKCWLSERFDYPCEGELFPTQREAQAEFERHGAKGHQWSAKK